MKRDYEVGDVVKNNPKFYCPDVIKDELFIVIGIDEGIAGRCVTCLCGHVGWVDSRSAARTVSDRPSGFIKAEV